MFRSTAIPALLTLLVGATLASYGGDPDAIDLLRRFEPPSLTLPLGTDHLGRDLLARLAGGGIRALKVVAITSTLSLAGGLALAAMAFAGPAVLRRTIRRIADLALAVPSLIVALVAAAVLGLTPASAALALTVGGMAGTTHFALGLFAAANAAGHVQAAVALGAAPLHIWKRHLLPQVWPPLILMQGYEAPRALVAWSGLTFLGLGADASQPDWGSMVYEYRVFLLDAPRLALAPIGAIAVLALIFSLCFDEPGPANAIDR